MPSPRPCGGPDGWRWAFYILAVPVVVVAVAALGLPEPPRGQHEKLDVLGEVIDDSEPVPLSFEAAFARITRIHTIRMCLIGFSAMGFGLFTGARAGQPVPPAALRPRRVRPRPDRDHRLRIGVLVVLPFVGRYYDRLYRQDPARALALIGPVLLPVAVIIPIQYSMPNAVLWAVFSVFTAMLTLSRVRHGRAGAHVGGPVPICAG